MREEATLHLPVTVDKSHIITLGERLYNPHLAYQRQSKLMRDAFGEEEFSLS